ncbi:MAG: adaptor protein MecA [Clostridia bacterium]|nr:adaptor protein MecA [Clostridia bacterium]
MEIVKISDKSIKFCLTRDEVREYDLYEGRELDTNEMKKIFSRLLLQAKKEVGFKYAKENIVAEIFSSRDGGCEIFVSCLLGEEKMYKDKREENLPPKAKAQNQIYMFENLESLVHILKEISERSISKLTSVYYDKENKKYYLILEDVSKKGLKFAFIVEFSKPVRSSAFQYIVEYCDLICDKNAHIVLPELF